PSGTLLQDNCGDIFSPTQFGLLGRLAVLSATRFGMILPSAKVVDLSVKISAPAGAAAKLNAIVATATAKIRLPNMVTSNVAAPAARFWLANIGEQPRCGTTSPCRSAFRSEIFDQAGVDQHAIEMTGFGAVIATKEQSIAAHENILLFDKRRIERQSCRFLHDQRQIRPFQRSERGRGVDRREIDRVNGVI